MTANRLLSDEEHDVLQEIMNIAFGNATADLAEVIDIYVVLNVPSVLVLDHGRLVAFLNETLNSERKADIVEQTFTGDFNGAGLLVFPDGAGNELMSLLDPRETGERGEDGVENPMEAGALLEIGNILIGACVGKVSGLLNTSVSYAPPNVLDSRPRHIDYIIRDFDPRQSAIVMKTVFRFEGRNVSGFLMIMTTQASIEWLRKALKEFVDAFITDSR